MKNPAAPQSTESGSASLKTMTSNRRSRSYVSQRVERKAPWEPRRVEGDGHVISNLWIYAATLLYGGQRVPAVHRHPLRPRRGSRPRPGFRRTSWRRRGSRSRGGRMRRRCRGGYRGRWCGCCGSSSRRGSCSSWSYSCCCRSCSCRRWARRTCWTNGPATGRGPTVAVAEILSKTGIAVLHPRSGARIAVCRIAVDHIVATLHLIQPQLVVGRLTDVGKVNSAPFDIEDPVGRSARNRGEDTAGATRESRAPGVCIGALVVPIREDGTVVAGPRQANVSERRIGCVELSVAVRGHVDAVVSHSTGGERERERNACYLVIPVIAGVSCARHDAAAYLSYVKPGAGCRRWGRSRRGCWASRRRWRRGRCRHTPGSFN
jgi:hypothetical protein